MEAENNVPFACVHAAGVNDLMRISERQWVRKVPVAPVKRNGLPVN